MFDLEKYDKDKLLEESMLFSYSVDDMARDDYIDEVSTLLGLEEEVIEKVLQALELVILHNLKKQGKKNNKDDIYKNFHINLPFLGQISLNPQKKGTRNALIYELIIDKDFLDKARKTYYDQQDLLTDEVESNFEDILLEKTKNLIG